MAQETVPTNRPNRASGILARGHKYAPPMPSMNIKTNGTRQPPIAAPPQPNFHHGLLISAGPRFVLGGGEDPIRSSEPLPSKGGGDGDAVSITGVVLQVK